MYIHFYANLRLLFVVGHHSEHTYFLGIGKSNNIFLKANSHVHERYNAVIAIIFPIHRTHKFKFIFPLSVNLRLLQIKGKVIKFQKYISVSKLDKENVKYGKHQRIH